MTVPKQKRSKSRQRKHRLHIYLKPAVLSLCPKCGKPREPHVVCWNCGYYKGREIINVLEKLDKKERKRREKDMKQKEVNEKKGTEGEKPLTWEGMSKT